MSTPQKLQTKHKCNMKSSTSFTTNGHPSKGKHIHSQCSLKGLEKKTVTKPKCCTYFRPWAAKENGAKSASTQALVDHHKNHTPPQKSNKVENFINHPSNSNNLTNISSTTFIPPSSTAVIQQSMANDMPPLQTLSTSPYAERFEGFTMDMVPLHTQPLYTQPFYTQPFYTQLFYAQPLYMNTAVNVQSYTPNYSKTNYNYMFNIHQQDQELPLLIPAHNIVNALPYVSLPINSVAGHYYQRNIEPHWSNVTYSNNMTTPYLQQSAANQIYPAAIQQNIVNRIQEGPSSAPPPTSAQSLHDNTRILQPKLSRAKLLRSHSLPSNGSAALHSQAIATPSLVENIDACEKLLK